MREEWVEALFEDAPLDAGVRVAVRERLLREWDAPGADQRVASGATASGRGRVVVSVAAVGVVALTIAGIVWLGNSDDARPPASNVPRPPLSVSVATTVPAGTIPETSRVEEPAPPSEQRPDSPVVVPATDSV